MRQNYRWTFALVVSLALAGATVAGQSFTPSLMFGEYGQVYLESGGYPDLVAGTCAAGQTCPMDPQLLPGSLNMPMGIATDAAGRVAVADTWNHRVQVFGRDGEHQLTLGGLGSRGVPADQIPQFAGFPGEVRNTLTGAVDPRFFYPTGVAIDATGKIAVADYWNHRVAIYYPDGRLFSLIGDYADVTARAVDADLGKFAYPYRVAVRPGTRLGDPMDTAGRLYVVDEGNHRVQIFGANLAPLGAFGGGAGDEAGRFYYPNDVTYDTLRDQLFVVDANNDRVQVFTADGEFLFQFGPGDLMVPLGIAVDVDGRIYVADKRDRVRIFTQDSPASVRHLGDFGSTGSGLGQVRYPGAIAYDGYRRLVIADTYNHRVQVFEDQDRPADLTPPVSTATLRVAPNAAGWVNAEQAVTFSATDVGAGVDTIVIDYVQPDRAEMHVAPETTLTFPEGVYVLDYYAVDRAGNRELPKRLVVRVDTTAPSLTCTSTTQVIWPVNHKMVPVSFAVTANDGLSGAIGFVLASAQSSEPDNGLGDGDQPNDLQGWAIGTADTTGFVRAERSGRGPGRVYSFRFESIDQAGNAGTCTVATVKVPRQNVK